MQKHHLGSSSNGLMIGKNVQWMYQTQHVIGTLQNADNTFGEGFDWENAPWYSIEGLNDVPAIQKKQ